MKYGLMVVAALLALLVASPVAALTQDEAQQMVNSVGCVAEVSVVAREDFNAYYGYGRIFLYGFENLPEVWQRYVLWHEIGHCIQAREGVWNKLQAKGPYEIEWDADAYAIRKMAEEGIDGAEVNEAIWAWVAQTYDWKGTKNGAHGTSVDRITRGRLNRVITHVEGA